MKKKVISLVLCLLMALSLIPTAVFAADDVVDDSAAIELQAQENEVVAYIGGGHGGGDHGDGDHGKPDGGDHGDKPGGGQTPSENYYDATHGFGYDAFTSGGNLTGLASVSVNGAMLTRNNATSTTGAAFENGIIVNLEAGYYIKNY